MKSNFFNLYRLIEKFMLNQSKKNQSQSNSLRFGAPVTIFENHLAQKFVEVNAKVLKL
jgi:hypothetical protein